MQAERMLLNGMLKNGKTTRTMKKIVFFAAVAALAAVSCVKEEGFSTQKAVLKASFEETKTVLAEGTKTHWTPNDQLTVFNNGKGNCLFKTNITENAAVATFEYLGGAEYFDTPETFHAFYPYSKAIATEDFQNFTGLEIPSVQKAVENGFDPAAALCYATGQSTNLAFQNLTALLKFTIDADEVYTVRVYATWGSKFAGACTFDGTTLTASVNQVVLKGPMRKGKTFYMAVAPGTYETLDVYVNNEKLSDLTRTNKTIEAGKIYDMGKLGNNRKTVLDWYNYTTNPASTISQEDVDFNYGDWQDYSAKYPFCRTDASWGSAYKVYYVAEDGITLTNPHDTEVRRGNGNPTKNGQMYSVFYQSFGMNLYFNIDWETKYNNEWGVYPIVDIQDRGMTPSYLLNRSYYDSNSRTLHFDFAIGEGTTLKLIHGQMSKTIKE